MLWLLPGGRQLGQDGPSVQASPLCKHQHPELQLPGSSKTAAKPRTRLGQLLRYEEGAGLVLPPWMLWQTCKLWGGRGRQAAPTFSSSTGWAGGEVYPPQPADDTPAAAESWSGAARCRRCTEDTQ